MWLLTDFELKAALTADPNLIEGIEVRDWKQNDSHIQPCSVDLHIGRIFLPGEEDKAAPGTPRARTDLILPTGQTAIVITRERLHFTSEFAGIGFPPSHVSAKGLLMTNPGHIDPGYVGTLRFTVINMSAEAFPLKEGDIIVTLLVYRLRPHSVAADYRARNGPPGSPGPSWDDVNRLAKDFVDVEARAGGFRKRRFKMPKTASIGWTLAPNGPRYGSARRWELSVS